MSDEPMNIMIGGEAGQGLATIGQLLSRILVRSGYFIVVTQSYESRIRGGHNTFTIRVGTDAIEAPREPLDTLVALNEETISLHGNELSPDGLIITDEAFKQEDVRSLKAPFKEFSVDQSTNTAALGILCSLLGLNRETAAEVLNETFGKKRSAAAESNLSVFTEAFNWAAGEDKYTRKLPRQGPSPEGRLMLNGNQAIALGAVSAGARFCSFYPMTPATSIPLTLIGMAERMDLVVEQAEDEIAAVNMAIGASYAGAPAMVATSGGGFALMVEGISLAAMTETPLVVVLAQRPGPATGLPTRTEQADLEFALYAGHGEFPRIILAPGTIEECFHLTRKAFELAEKYQGPVFVLTDQFLADSLRAVEPFAVEHLDFVRPGADTSSVGVPYLRHVVTDNGVSPRLIPGQSRHLVITDSDEHTEDGHLTENLNARKQQVDKRLKKGEGIIKDLIPPEIGGGENPEILLVSWGSSKGSVEEAASQLRDSGTEVTTLHFSQVWPLVPEYFIELLGRAGRVICVEGNARGQFARLIRSETGFEIMDRITRYDGLPITPEYILRGLEKLRSR